MILLVANVDGIIAGENNANQSGKACRITHSVEEAVFFAAACHRMYISAPQLYDAHDVVSSVSHIHQLLLSVKSHATGTRVARKCATVISKAIGMFVSRQQRSSAARRHGVQGTFSEKENGVVTDVDCHAENLPPQPEVVA